MAIEVGQPALDFTLSDSDGNQVSLTDFRGKNVIVFFYPKDETPGCTKEACGFRDLWTEIQALNTVILGVSPDDEASHRGFRDNHNLPFLLLADTEKTVMSAYGAFGEKMNYGKKIIGIIRSTVWIAPDGTIKKRWIKVPNAAAHPAKVLEALRVG